MNSNAITISQTIAAPVEKVWDFWTRPEHITQWNAASDDWYTPRAQSDVRNGGRFEYRMEARDGSVGFDFGGTYTTVAPHQHLHYTLDDNRKADVTFAANGSNTTVTQRFEPESENSPELQQQGWQAILDAFKKYAETH